MFWNSRRNEIILINSSFMLMVIILFISPPGVLTFSALGNRNDKYILGQTRHGSRIEKGITETTIILSAGKGSDTNDSNDGYWRFVMQMDNAKLISSTGAISYPPMKSVPCKFISSSTDDENSKMLSSLIHEVIQPPSVDELYEWYVEYQGSQDNDPSWAVVWPTAISLMEYLVNHRNDILDNKNEQQHVVELGCGLGLVGLTCAALGASRVTLTDREPYALHCAMSTLAVHSNIMEKNVVQAAMVDWTNLPDTLVQSASLIVASDVLYDADTIEQFAKTCIQLLRRPSTNDKNPMTILISDPINERCAGARQLFLDTIKQYHSNANIDIIHPPPYQLLGNNISNESSPDALDHYQRVQEPTVIIKCSIINE